MDIVEKKNFFKAYKTVLEMLTDRGNLLPENLTLTYSQFEILYESNNLYIYLETNNEKIYVYFHTLVKSFAKKDFTSTLNKLKKEYGDDLHIIFVTKDKLNQTLSKDIVRMKQCESFVLKSLVFNITKHYLIPKVEIISTEEEDELLEVYNTTKLKLPRILLSDPLVKYYAAKSGNIFRITRPSKNSGIILSYRCVK
jgi:DNA-directed RNA polymerase subunit H (RpoH/RPB5)|tara:strand:- start:3359 stop:3949 length:591 start_codon:yes stop_codon:yes gene_type:complete